MALLIKKLMKNLSKNEQKVENYPLFKSFYLLKKLLWGYFGLNSRAIFNTFHFNQSLAI